MIQATHSYKKIPEKKKIQALSPFKYCAKAARARIYHVLCTTCFRWPQALWTHTLHGRAQQTVAAPVDGDDVLVGGLHDFTGCEEPGKDRPPGGHEEAQGNARDVVGVLVVKGAVHLERVGVCVLVNVLLLHGLCLVTCALPQVRGQLVEHLHACSAPALTSGRPPST